MSHTQKKTGKAPASRDDKLVGRSVSRIIDHDIMAFTKSSAKLVTSAQVLVDHTLTGYSHQPQIATNRRPIPRRSLSLTPSQSPANLDERSASWA